MSPVSSAGRRSTWQEAASTAACTSALQLLCCAAHCLGQTLNSDFSSPVFPYCWLQQDYFCFSEEKSQRPLSLVCLSKEESGIWLVLACYFDSTSLPFALLGSVSTSGLDQKSGKWPICRKKKMNSLLSAKCFVTLHQERQRIHSQDTVEFWPQCWAGLGILLIPNNLCCCSVRKTSPEHSGDPTKH